MRRFDSYLIEAKVTNPDQVFFTKDGIDVNASDPWWKKFIPRKKVDKR